jgi:hypothetical protein
MKSSWHSLIPFLSLLLTHLGLPSPELDPVLFRLLFCTSCCSASTLLLSLRLMLRPTVSQPVCLGIEHPSGAYDQIFFRSEYGMRLTVTFLIPWGALSHERTGLSFVCATGPCQRSLSRVLVPWDLRPYFTVSDLRLPVLSPPTTRRVMVEVFDPASTRVTLNQQLNC